MDALLLGLQRHMEQCCLALYLQLQACLLGCKAPGELRFAYGGMTGLQLFEEGL